MKHGRIANVSGGVCGQHDIESNAFGHQLSPVYVEWKERGESGVKEAITAGNGEKREDGRDWMKEDKISGRGQGEMKVKLYE